MSEVRPVSGRRTVVFVPGLGANGAVYEPLLSRLREKYDVRSADLPLDFPEGELTWEFFFDAIDAVSRTAREVYLLGHSMGGGVALKYAAARPEKVVKTVAICPVLFPFKRHRHKWRERVWNLLVAARHLHLAHAVRALGILRSRAGDGRAGKLYRFSRSIDLRLDLPRLRNATILWPKHEEVVPRRQFDEVIRRYRNVSGVIVPGSHQGAR